MIRRSWEALCPTLVKAVKSAHPALCTWNMVSTRKARAKIVYFLCSPLVPAKLWVLGFISALQRVHTVTVSVTLLSFLTSVLEITLLCHFSCSSLIWGSHPLLRAGCWHQVRQLVQMEWLSDLGVPPSLTCWVLALGTSAGPDGMALWVDETDLEKRPWSIWA